MNLDTMTREELQNYLKEKERESDSYQIDYEHILKNLHIEQRKSYEDLKKLNIYSKIKDKHNKLSTLITLLKLLENEDNGYKSVFQKNLIDLESLFSHFNYDFYIIYKSLDYEIDQVKEKIRLIGIEDSFIIDFFVNEFEKD